MLGVYNYTVVMTYVAMIVSFVGISYVLDGNYKEAILCLMVSGILDMFDGKVASTKKNRTSFEKNFGIQIDSMSDLICYGVLPAMIVYKLGCESKYVPAHNIVTAICACYLLCALIRLAFFNVDEAERQKETTEERHIYKGVSINVDFYSGFVYNMLGLPVELYTPIFAMARISGWAAHRMEELANNGKIIRPAYMSICKKRDYVNIEER